METGRLAVLKGVYDLEIKSFPIPDVKEDGMLIKMEAASICGSDGHFIRMNPPYPSNLGHEFAGKIVKMGSKANDTIHAYGGPLKEGDRIVIYPWITCGVCDSCMRNGPGVCGVCDNGFIYGGPIGGTNTSKYNVRPEEFPYFKGGFGEYAYIFPGTYVWKIPDEMPSSIASMLDPTAVAVRAIEMAQTETGVLGESLNTNTKAVVIGAGPIGTLTALILRIMGVEEVIITDAKNEKLEKAKEVAGVDKAVNIAGYTTEQKVEMIRDMTHGGADLVIQCANTTAAAVEGLQFVRKLGTFIEVGTSMFGADVTVNLSSLVFCRNARVIGLIANNPRAFDKAFHLLQRYKKYPFDKLFTHKIYSLDDLLDTLKKMNDPDYMKGVLIFDK